MHTHPPIPAHAPSHPHTRHTRGKDLDCRALRSPKSRCRCRENLDPSEMCHRSAPLHTPPAMGAGVRHHASRGGGRGARTCASMHARYSAHTAAQHARIHNGPLVPRCGISRSPAPRAGALRRRAYAHGMREALAAAPSTWAGSHGCRCGARRGARWPRAGRPRPSPAEWRARFESQTGRPV